MDQGHMGPTKMDITKPMIASVNGYCVEGGLELAVMCDLRVLEENSKLGFLKRGFGVPLIDGAAVRLPSLIGMSRAMDLILTGMLQEPREALDWGPARGQGPIIDAEEGGLIQKEFISGLGSLFIIFAVIKLGLLKRLSGIRQASTIRGQYFPYDNMHYSYLPHPGSKVRLQAHNQKFSSMSSINDVTTFLRREMRCSMDSQQPSIP